MHRLGIDRLSGQRAGNLSGGESQRTSIARALAMKPEILLMDEPFSALDYPTRKSLLFEMGDILHASGMTSVFVTHDFSEIPALTRQVAVLYNGNNTYGILDSPDPFIPKSPYDKANVPVKRINAFQIGVHGRGAVLFDP